MRVVSLDEGLEQSSRCNAETRATMIQKLAPSSQLITDLQARRLSACDNNHKHYDKDDLVAVGAWVAIGGCMALNAVAAYYGI